MMRSLSSGLCSLRHDRSGRLVDALPPEDAPPDGKVATLDLGRRGGYPNAVDSVNGA